MFQGGQRGGTVERELLRDRWGEPWRRRRGSKFVGSDRRAGVLRMLFEYDTRDLELSRRASDRS